MLGPFMIGAVPQLIKEYTPETVLYIDPSSEIGYRAPITVGRIYYDLPVQEALLNGNPIISAGKLASDAVASARRNGIQCWMGVNEPSVDTDSKIAKLCNIERIRTQMLNAEGLRSVVLSLSVGWPAEDLTTHKLDVDAYQDFLTWLPSNNYVGLHEYFRQNGPLAPDSYNPNGPSLVWRFKWWDFDKSVLVTECGMDLGGDPYTSGWKAQKPPAMSIEQWARQYNDWMVDYLKLVSQDQRFKGAVWFCIGGNWTSFDIGEHLPYFRGALTYKKPDGGGGDTTVAYVIKDVAGNVKTQAWLDAEWGVVVDTSLRLASGPNFVLTELREVEGASSMYAMVLDKDSNPWGGRYVGRYWPDAPNTWPGGTKPANIPAPPEATTHAIFGATNDAGLVSFGLGGGDYAGPGDGVSELWVAEHDNGTDCVKKLGMKPNTVHRTLRPTFKYAPSGSPEPPTPPTPGTGIYRVTGTIAGSIPVDLLVTPVEG